MPAPGPRRRGLRTGKIVQSLQGGRQVGRKARVLGVSGLAVPKQLSRLVQARLLQQDPAQLVPGIGLARSALEEVAEIGLGVREAMAADDRHDSQFGFGLWSRDTPWGANGYLIDTGWDFLANTSFHVLTTDGIRGRDVLEPGSPRPRALGRPRSGVRRPPVRRPPPFGSTSDARLSPLE